ncbi:MAG: HlyD family efflux transporter periplasmic adaptor subunit [Planctomycetota bacterium]
MTKSPATRGTTDTAAENVALREEDLESLLAKLQQGEKQGFAAPTSRPSRVQSERAEQAATQVLEIVREMVLSADRTHAATRLTAKLHESFPNCTVRVGWGVENLEWIFDARLGLLGVENALFERFEVTWKACRNPESTKPHVSGGWILVPLLPSEALNADATQTSGFAAMAIGPLSESDYGRQAIMESWSDELTQTVAETFFSRPNQTWWRHLLIKAGRLWGHRKWGVPALIALALLLLIPIPYRVDATAVVVARDGRVVAAPFAATLSETLVRPGDRVKEGQTLARLDGRSVRIELESVLADLDQAIKDEDIALAQNQIAEAQLAGLRRRGLEAKRELLQSRIEQLAIVSPCDGVVIAGDLRHAVGNPLEVGQSLMEVAPPGAVEVELEIPESEIGFVQQEQPVNIWFPVAARTRWNTQVDTVWPSATLRDEQNVFVATGEIDAGTEGGALKVGMRGYAVMKSAWRPWTWRWLREPVGWLAWRLQP